MQCIIRFLGSCINKSMLSSSRPTNAQQRLEQLRLPSAPPTLSPLRTTNSASTTAATMDELWEDINPSPIQHHHSHRRSGRQGLILQDFLRPPPPPPPTSFPGRYPDPSLSSSSTNNPPPVTYLSINPSPEFHFLDTPSPSLSSGGSAHLGSGLTNSSSTSFNHCPSEALSNSSSLLPCFGSRKRINVTDSGPGDQRQKRLIKNRESAARSRARKQAYTIELELEVAQLMEENARLRKQQGQLCLAAAAAQHPKKHTLHRSSTAPF